MDKSKYTAFTAREAAIALGFIPTDRGDDNVLWKESWDSDDDESEAIARGMLAGETEFMEDELWKLADFKGVTVEELTELDPAFRDYADPVTEAKTAIARNMLHRDFSVEFAAELCELSVEKVRKLKG